MAHEEGRIKESNALPVIGFHPSAHLPVVEQRLSLHEPCFWRLLGDVALPFSLIDSDLFSPENFSDSCEQSLEILVGGRALVLRTIWLFSF